MLKRVFPFLFVSVAAAWEIELLGGPQVEHYRGWVSYKGDPADVKKDLHIKDRVKYFAGFNLHHSLSLLFIPLPDVRVEYLQVNSDGYGKARKSFTFGGIKVYAQDKVYSKFRFNQLDTTFYYTPLSLKFVKASWGLGLKVIDLKVYIRSETLNQIQQNPIGGAVINAINNLTGANISASTSKTATIYLPYLYGAIRGNFLFLKPFAEVKALKVGTNYFYDLRAGLTLSKEVVKNVSLTFTGGYRLQRYRVDDIEDVSADVRMKGVFCSLGVSLTF